MSFLRAALSPDGYAKVVGIVGAEDALAASSGRQLSADNYWLAFFGEPSADDPLGLAVRRSPPGRECDRHRRALVSLANAGRRFNRRPTRSEGVTVAPLAGEVQAGLALMHALDDEQRAAARVQRPNELWAGAGKDGLIPPLEGISACPPGARPSRALLLDAVALWVGLLPAASAEVRLAEIAAELAETTFRLARRHRRRAGPSTTAFRVRALIIEFATQSRSGGESAHYHSIYRDPTNEYAAATLDAL